MTSVRKRDYNFRSKMGKTDQCPPLKLSTVFNTIHSIVRQQRFLVLYLQSVLDHQSVAVPASESDDSALELTPSPDDHGAISTQVNCFQHFIFQWPPACQVAYLPVLTIQGARHCRKITYEIHDLLILGTRLRQCLVRLRALDHQCHRQLRQIQLPCQRFQARVFSDASRRLSDRQTSPRNLG